MGFLYGRVLSRPHLPGHAPPGHHMPAPCSPLPAPRHLRRTSVANCFGWSPSVTIITIWILGTHGAINTGTSCQICARTPLWAGG